ncbi:acyl-CoA dehydrogenase family protein [Ornithinimicrobium sp. Arc0846-15]|nr:acyl-CoA dehydrogenase family protein [Ornithinimicrobium laminariae]
MSSLHPFFSAPAFDSAKVRHWRANNEALLQQISHGVIQRELDGALPIEAVASLRAAKVGALRLPEDRGGAGFSLPELTQIWIDLASVDNNLAQALRGHYALVEDRLWQHQRGADQSWWFDRFAHGEIAGNAWSEAGATAIDTQRTRLSPDGKGGYRINGTKFYTTGSIFAQWADVYALRQRPGHADDFVIALVDTREPGVAVIDDWDGFGQRGTGSGSTHFDDVPVPAENVLVFTERFPYQTALYQVNLLATLVGVGHAAVRETVAAVQARDRNYSHANADRVRDDPQILARIGDIAASVYAAEAAVIRNAEALQRVSDAANASPTEIQALNEAGEIESSLAQVVVTELILKATTDLFDTLGASATSRTKGLDRHWRNARTLSSHNPRVLKAKVVGDHLVNDAPPPYAWAIGVTPHSGARGQNQH